MSYPNIVNDINELEIKTNDLENKKVNLSDLINLIYPVGSIYMSINNVSPETFLGGSWEQIQDTFLLSAGTKYSAGSTGGEASHTLSVAETPAHTHTRGTMEITGSTTPKNRGLWRNGTDATASGAFSFTTTTAGSTVTTASGYKGSELVFTASKSWTGETSSVGGNAAHNNMPPYLTVYMWKRIA